METREQKIERLKEQLDFELRVKENLIKMGATDNLAFFENIIKNTEQQLKGLEGEQQ